MFFSNLPPTVAQLYRITPQEENLDYKAEALGANIIFVMQGNDWFNEEAWAGASRVWVMLSESHSDFAVLIDNVPKLRRVDFLSLLILRHDYADQTHIDKR